MFLKLVCFGRKICIKSIKIGFKEIHHLQSRENLRLLLPSLILRLQGRCRLDETFSKSFAGFQKVKVPKYLGYKCPLFKKKMQYSFCACVRNILEIVTFVIENMKLTSFSLFLDAFPPRPKIDHFAIWSFLLYINCILNSFTVA